MSNHEVIEDSQRVMNLEEEHQVNSTNGHAEQEQEEDDEMFGPMAISNWKATESAPEISGSLWKQGTTQSKQLHTLPKELC